MLLADKEDLAPLPDLADTNPQPPTLVEQPEHPITLNAISATRRARGKAMRLESFIQHTLIQVFIDSGAD